MYIADSFGNFMKVLALIGSAVTLVMSMRFAVLDTASGKLVLERLLSFRSDNDEGWRHAGDYAAREVAGTLP